MAPYIQLARARARHTDFRLSSVDTNRSTSVTPCVGRATSRHWKRSSTIPPVLSQLRSRARGSQQPLREHHSGRKGPVAVLCSLPVIPSSVDIRLALSVANQLREYPLWSQRLWDLARQGCPITSRAPSATQVCHRARQDDWQITLQCTAIRGLDCYCRHKSASQQYSASSSQPLRHAAGNTDGSASLLRAHLEPCSSHLVVSMCGGSSCMAVDDSRAVLRTCGSPRWPSPCRWKPHCVEIFRQYRSCYR